MRRRRFSTSRTTPSRVLKRSDSPAGGRNDLKAARRLVRAWKVEMGPEARDRSWQKPFPLSVPCCYCGGVTRLGFVAYEGLEPDNPVPAEGFLADLYRNKGEGSYWLHDACSVAVYFCVDCLEPTAKYYQG